DIYSRCRCRFLSCREERDVTPAWRLPREKIATQLQIAPPSPISGWTAQCRADLALSATTPWPQWAGLLFFISADLALSATPPWPRRAAGRALLAPSPHHCRSCRPAGRWTHPQSAFLRAWPGFLRSPAVGTETAARSAEPPAEVPAEGCARQRLRWVVEAPCVPAVAVAP